MGKNFCICNDASNTENESNIFSGKKTKRVLEKETIKTLSASEKPMSNNCSNKSFIEENSTFNNSGLNVLLNEINKNDKYKFPNNYFNNRLLSDINKHDNFHCSGKFNELLISNGGNEHNENNEHNEHNEHNEYNDNNSLNISDKKDNGNGGRIMNKNQFSFNNFKTFIDGNNNIAIIGNKDNNTNSSYEINNIQIPKNDNNNNEDNGSPKVEDNCKDNTNCNDNDNDNDNDRYNNISQYSDESNKDYLNNESNYYNSNRREEIRDNKSLQNEES